MFSEEVNYSSNQTPDDIENTYIPAVTWMRNRLNDLPGPSLSPYGCIYKVPERLRGVKQKDYTPHVVSIGPFHRENQDLLYMEEHKQRYLQHFLHWTSVDLEVYVKKIMDQEARLRGCYEGGASEFQSDVFVRIILVDAAFIIELLLRYFFKDLRDDNDWIFKKPWMLQNIAPDMILLENQLPFFILVDLFAYVPRENLLAVVPPESLSAVVRFTENRPQFLIWLSYEFFKGTVRLRGNGENLASCSEVKHFVDLIRTLHLPPLTSSQTEGPTSCCSPKVEHFCDRIRGFLSTKKSNTVGLLKTPCVKNLQQAGVKFQVRRSSKSLFDIQFNNQGILEIPQVEINDYTELTLKNLLAFEQCHCMENHISDYLCIMDGFVNTETDVDLLVEVGIVVNALGDNSKVSSLINKIRTGVSWNHEDYYFAALSEDLNDYCGKPWNKWKASLKQKYFDTPWAMISVFAAGFLIALTIIQTVCTLISVIN